MCPHVGWLNTGCVCLGGRLPTTTRGLLANSRGALSREPGGPIPSLLLSSGSGMVAVGVASSEYQPAEMHCSLCIVLGRRPSSYVKQLPAEEQASRQVLGLRAALVTEGGSASSAHGQHRVTVQEGAGHLPRPASRGSVCGRLGLAVGATASETLPGLTGTLWPEWDLTLRLKPLAAGVSWRLLSTSGWAGWAVGAAGAGGTPGLAVLPQPDTLLALPWASPGCTQKGKDS